MQVHPTNLDNSRARTTMLAVGADGGCLESFCFHLSYLFSFSLSLGDGSIPTEILSQTALEPEIIN